MPRLGMFVTEFIVAQSVDTTQVHPLPRPRLILRAEKGRPRLTLL